MKNFFGFLFSGKWLPKRAFTLAKKEIYQYLYTPSMYGAVVFFLVFCAVWMFYFQGYFENDRATLRPYFGVFPLAFIVVIPVLTMKSWAEERKTGTIELLLTMPYTEWDIVIGKFLSLLSVLAVMLVLTIPVPLSLIPLGRFELGVIVCEYLGAFLLGMCSITVGLLLSSLSKNQAGSFLATLGVLLVVMLVNQFVFMFNLPYRLASLINFFSLSYHFDSFTKGLIDSRNLLFFILSSILFLYINTRVIIFRKWK